MHTRSFKPSSTNGVGNLSGCARCHRPIEGLSCADKVADKSTTTLSDRFCCVRVSYGGVIVVVVTFSGDVCSCLGAGFCDCMLLEIYIGVVCVCVF